MITRYRRNRNLLLIILVCAVSFMSVGFAAFSSQLTISSSAIVKPDASAFRVVFSSSGTQYLTNDVSGSRTGDATAGKAVIANDGDSPTIKNLTATFTGPGESVKYEFYVYNSGAYVAYLTDIKFNNVDGESLPKVCTAIDATSVTDSLMNSACNDISVTVDVGNNSVTNSTSMISGNSLDKNAFKKVTVTIKYEDNGNRSDGDFKVEFGDIKFTYSTVDSPALISFVVDGKTYYAEDNMTWEEWINSEYNVDNFFIVGVGYIGTELCYTIENVFDSDVIYSNDYGSSVPGTCSGGSN